MEYSEKIAALRGSVGMNRKQFCDYLEIPYRTMSDWEAGLRVMPPYVYSLIEYKVKTDLLDGVTPQKPEKKKEKAVSQKAPGQARHRSVSSATRKQRDEVSESDQKAEKEASTPAHEEPGLRAFVVDGRYDSMPWITKEDNLLKEMFFQGKCLEEISEKLQRSPDKIAARLKKLGIK